MVRLVLILTTILSIASAGWYFKSVFDERNQLRGSLKVAEDALTLAKAEDTRVSVITDEHIQTVEKIVYVDKIVTKEIVKYRERVVNRCELDTEWVRIHNQAASGMPQDTSASEFDGTASGSGKSGVDDADALEITTANYNKYHLCRAKLETLQKLIGPYIK